MARNDLPARYESFLIEHTYQKHNLEETIRDLHTLVGSMLTGEPIHLASHYNRNLLEGNSVGGGGYYSPGKLPALPSGHHEFHFADRSANSITFLTKYCDDLYLWTIRLKKQFVRMTNSFDVYDYDVEARKVTKAVNPNFNVIFGGQDAADMMLKEVNPPGYRFWQERGLEKHAAKMLIVAPWLARLSREGFAFTKRFLNKSSCYFQNSDITKLNTLCKRGDTLDEIFKTERFVYEALKDEPRIELWDSYRKMVKQKKIDENILINMRNECYSKENLDEFSSLMNRTFNQKKLFTADELQKYLEKLDKVEAMDLSDAMWVLNEYLKVCESIGMPPNFETESLKKQLDVAKRIQRQESQKIDAMKMDNSCMQAARYDIDDETYDYIIKSIRSYDELLAEAKAMHTGISTYAKSIADGLVSVYTMRKKVAPDKSYIILITSNSKNSGVNYARGLMAYDQEITDDKAKDFIERWSRYITKKSMKLIEEAQ